MVAVTRVVVVQIQELVVSFMSRLNLALMVGCTLTSMGMKSAASTHTPSDAARDSVRDTMNKVGVTFDSSQWT